MRWLELKIPPPVIALLLCVAIWKSTVTGWSSSLPERIQLILYLSIWSIGGLIALAGEYAFWRAKTTINPLKPENASRLVTTGIYKFTRNPMYLGLLCLITGWAIYLDSLIGLLEPVLFVAYINRFQIMPEERILSDKFGTDYAAYMSRTRRWI